MPDATSEIACVLAGDIPRHAPGIYFGMDEAEYHADPSHGSSSIKRLRTNPFDWFWNSAYNPIRLLEPQEDDADKQSINQGDGKAVGTAIHCYVLDGPERFRAKYIRRPQHLKTIRDADARRVAPHGQRILHGDDYARAVLAAEMIRKNPELTHAFSGGQPEVSVFWNEPFQGRLVPMKARFDYLKLRATVDLKSIRNTNDLPFPLACALRIRNMRYDIQVAHYNAARERMRSMLRYGLVFGAENVDSAWLEKVCASETWSFVIVFYQAEDAPLTWATMFSRDNPAVEDAKRDVGVAVANYVRCAETWGFSEPWLMAEPMREFEPSEVPGWDFRR